MRFLSARSIDLLTGAMVLLLAGCPSTREAAKETPPPVPSPTTKKPPAPAITVEVASINLAAYKKKIERADVDKFAAELKHEKVDVLTVQGVTRYPDLPNRVDVIGRLSSVTGMRSAFGETMNFSGQQHGNAVFSEYPIRSSENTPYDGLRSIALSAALQAIVDCGARDVVVVSTGLPDGSSPEDESTCVTKLGSFSTLYIGDPVIITGNLPRAGTYRSLTSYLEAEGIKPGDAPRVWFSGGGSLQFMSARTVGTVFGPMAVVIFGVFRQSQP